MISWVKRVFLVKISHAVSSIALCSMNESEIKGYFGSEWMKIMLFGCNYFKD